MREYYKKVTNKSQELGLSADIIIKVIELQTFASGHKVELYSLEGKLKMREFVQPFTKEDKERLDKLFKDKKDDGGSFGDLLDNFGEKFGNMFGGKK